MNGFVVWFTGLSAAGKSTIAELVANELEAGGMVIDRLDGDIVREHLTKDLVGRLAAGCRGGAFERRVGRRPSPASARRTPRCP